MIVTADHKKHHHTVQVGVALMKVTDASADVNNVCQIQSVCGLLCVAMPFRQSAKYASSNSSLPH